MVDFSNKWKFLSIGLMVILATGFVAPQAFGYAVDPLQAILNIVKNIQTKVNDSGFGLQAIQNNVNTKASQTSVNSLQTTANAIKASTDSLTIIGTNVTSIGMEVIPRDISFICTMGNTNGIAVVDTQATRYETILALDHNNKVSWQIDSMGFGLNNKAPQVTQSDLSEHVAVGGPLGMPFTVANGFGLSAFGAQPGDTVDVTIGYSGPSTPTITCG